MGVIRSWSTNAGVCNKPGALGYGFARGETTNCLFWSSSSELWAIGERFLLASTKTASCFKSQQRAGCAEAAAGQPSRGRRSPADLLDEPGERCCAAGPPSPLATLRIPKLLSHPSPPTQVREPPSPLWWKTAVWQVSGAFFFKLVASRALSGDI